MTVDALPEYLKQLAQQLREQLLNGTYQPQPVTRVEIAKPNGRGQEIMYPGGFHNCFSSDRVHGCFASFGFSGAGFP